MIEETGGYTTALLVISAIVLSATLFRSALAAIRIPTMVAFLLVGIAFTQLRNAAPSSLQETQRIIEFLGHVGIVTLLFRVGLETDLKGLLAQLRPAVIIWFGNVAASALLGFAAVYWLFDGALIPALFGAAAMSATSIGISTTIWRDEGMLATPEGALLLDVAELDDISAVVMMSLLFVVAPLLHESGGGGDWTVLLLTEAIRIVGVLVVLVGACYVFSRYLEKPLRRWFARRDKQNGAILFAVGVALLIAAMAELAGLSLAIGALFAGFAFSRDPARRSLDRSFTEIDALFSPFFFVWIGTSVALGSVTDALGLTAILLVAAIAGKVIGVMISAKPLIGTRGATLLGLSMVPRAEIALIIMGYGHALGSWAVPDAMLNAMVMVALATAILTPLILAPLLAREAEKEPIQS